MVAGWLPPAGDALGLLLLWINLALSFGLVMAPGPFSFWKMLCGLLAIGLLAGKLARMGGAGFGTVLTPLALSHTGGRAFWNGLLGKGVPCQDGAHPELAPARTGSLRSEELTLLLALWAALAGVAAVHGASWQAVIWCAALFAQSVPYLAAVFLAWQPALAAPRCEARRPGLGRVARSGSGD